MSPSEWRPCTASRHRSERPDSISEQRQRATALLVRDDRVLLVRDRGRTSFSFPGGGIGPGELPISAVARELYEETTLTATSIAFLFQQGGKSNNHHVFRVDAVGEVDVADDADVVEHVWWDRNGGICVYPHVTEKLGRLAGQ